MKKPSHSKRLDKLEATATLILENRAMLNVMLEVLTTESQRRKIVDRAGDAMADLIRLDP